MVDGVVIDGSEVPLCMLDDLGRGGMSGRGVGDQLRQSVQPLVSFSWSTFSSSGTKSAGDLGGDLTRRDAKLGQPIRPIRRVNHPCAKGRSLGSTPGLVKALDTITPSIGSAG